MHRSLRWSLVALLLGGLLWGLFPVRQLATAARGERGAVPYDGGSESILLRTDGQVEAAAPRRMSERGTGAAEIQLLFSNNAPGSVPPEMKAATRYAADIWEGYIVSPVPITIEVRWESLGRTFGNAFLYAIVYLTQPRSVNTFVDHCDRDVDRCLLCCWQEVAIHSNFPPTLGSALPSAGPFLVHEEGLAKRLALLYIRLLLLPPALGRLPLGVRVLTFGWRSTRRMEPW